MHSELNIPVIEHAVRLGCSAEERLFPHRVHYAVAIRFGTVPGSCKTDRIEETPCYARISEVLATVSQSREFATIERLTQSALDAVMDYLATLPSVSPASVKVTVNKLNPPVTAIKSGAAFSLTLNL